MPESSPVFQSEVFLGTLKVRCPFGLERTYVLVPKRLRTEKRAWNTYRLKGEVPNEKHQSHNVTCAQSQICVTTYVGRYLCSLHLGGAENTMPSFSYIKYSTRLHICHRRLVDMRICGYALTTRESSPRSKKGAFPCASFLGVCFAP